MKREEYPRPQFVRENWQNLNGEWDFRFDDEKIGKEKKYFLSNELYDRKIEVPFVYQSHESGINDRTPHDVVWYFREFSVSHVAGQRVLLHFGAVDYIADVYINGQHVKNHQGGHTSFEVDITDSLTNENRQTLSVRAFDAHKDESQPRGKQFWEDKSAGIWYTNSTGIWQTVWFEVVEESYISNLKMTPNLDAGKVEMEVSLNQTDEVEVGYEISFKDEKIAAGSASFTEKTVKFDIELIQNHIFRTNFHSDGWTWTPENPNLFDVKLVLRRQEQVLDVVSSYFGLRKIHTENGMVYLNNKPYYQKLVLDQGYWPEGLLTAPNDIDFREDIQLAKEMGFNGCRKHQKTEDPRFLYWADKLGYLVWGECAAPTVFNEQSVGGLVSEWTEIVARDFNHPSIVTWVPINESWGVPNISFDREEEHFSQTMYHFLHALDKTRLVISNDGWAATETDICAIHNYEHGQADETAKYAHFSEMLSTTENLLTEAPTAWPIFANGFAYQDQPILLTEFGGIGYDVSGQPGWGYTSVANEQEFLQDYQRIMTAVYASKALWGYCYTQISDVEQEINGLLTYNRQPKCNLEEIRKINDSYHLPRLAEKR